MFNFKDKKFDIISCGEIIMRLSPENGSLLIQNGDLKRYVGGAELNVLSGISNLGGKTSFISKIPSHDLGIFSKRFINSNNINTDYLVYDKNKNSRLPIYYYEYGASPRKPNVIYDRQHSSFQNLSELEIDDTIYNLGKIFHISGISLGLCENSKILTKKLMDNFKKNNTLISFDVNFRRNLWGCEENAKKEISEILPLVDILFASEETLRKMFGQSGSIENILRNFSKEYNISLICSSQRIVNSPKSHDFNSIIYEKFEDKFYFEKPYNNIEIIDRIGSGDAFVAGTLFGIAKYKNLEKALEIGNALGALKNTFYGDNSCISLEIIENIIKEHKSGSLSEMNR